VCFGGVDPVEAIDRALLGLVDSNPQPVHLQGLPLERLERALWRCPACLDEARWEPATLSCGCCGASWSNTADGWFARDGEADVPLAELAKPVWQAEEVPVRLTAGVSRARSMFGPILPLEPLFTGDVEIGPRGVTFGETSIPVTTLKDISTERADTLQLATAEGMWQVRLPQGSAFRLQLALLRWRGADGFAPAARPAARVRASVGGEPAGMSRRRLQAPLAGAAVAAGVLVAECAALARPFFLFVNLMEAHAPYQEVPVASRTAWTSPDLSLAALEAIGERSHMAQVLGTAVDPADLKTTFDLQDGAIAAADRYLGQLLEIVGDDTVWIVLSDHGELLGEHGLWGHNLGLYEPLVSVPLVMAGPGMPRGTVIDDPVSLVDVVPTVCALAETPAPSRTAGMDLLPVLRGERSLAGRTLRAEHLRTDFLTSGWQLLDPLGDHSAIRARRAAARRGDHKRILAEDGTDQSFDLAADPGEQRPSPGATVELRLELPGPGLPGQEAGFDEATSRALGALGYLR